MCDSESDRESKYSMGVDMLAGIRDGQASDLWRYFVPDKDKKPTWGDTDVVDVSSLIAETEFPNQRAFVEQAASSANTDEGWFKCADKDGTCSCSQGKVRIVVYFTRLGKDRHALYIAEVFETFRPSFTNFR